MTRHAEHSLKTKIIAHNAAHPSASYEDIAQATGASVFYVSTVFQRTNMKRPPRQKHRWVRDADAYYQALLKITKAIDLQDAQEIARNVIKGEDL